MKSQMNDDIPEYSLRPQGAAAKRKGAPWLLFILALAGAGGAGYLAWTEHGQRGADGARIGTLSASLSAAEAKQKDAEAKLEAAESERAALKSSNDELSKSVQVKEEELAKLKQTENELQDKLKGEIKSGDIVLTNDGGKLRVGLVDKVLFNSGEAMINKRGENVLMRVGAILKEVADRQIQVSGHTDKEPIGEKKAALFPTNWELSTARATTVVRFLQEKAGVPGERLVASGYGEFHPVASNKSATGRARNRRIEILLVPTIAPKAMPKSKIAAKAAKPAK